MMQQTLQKILRETLLRLVAEEKLVLGGEEDSADLLIPVIEIPREEHGDLSSNVAMVLARLAKRPSRTIAEQILENISDPAHVIKRAEIAGPGFLNFFLHERFLQSLVSDIHRQGATWGRSAVGNGESVLLEFVSANPAGPLNIVNARAATVGDTLANLFAACGYRADREYYVNDEGTQIDKLGQSLYSRYSELHGRPVPIPEDGYHGGYLIDIAKELMREKGALGAHDNWSEMAVEHLLRHQQASLKRFGVRFDRVVRQHTLTFVGKHKKALLRLRQNGFVYEKDGAVWFATTRFGDEKDRVLVRQSGEHTYFSVDIAYHMEKAERYQAETGKRGYHRLINLLGPDHHGYIPRLKAAIQALGYPMDLLEVYIIQQVTLQKGGEPVKMSKRAGEFVTMDELIDEVGSDAARFFFNLRHRDSPLEFDLDLAKAQNDENPLYYVQYAHARIQSLIRNAAEQGIPLPPEPGEVDLSPLCASEELSLIKKMSLFPDLVRQCMERREPHHLTAYGVELARAFHAFYTVHRVLGARGPASAGPGEREGDDHAGSGRAEGAGEGATRAGTGGEPPAPAVTLARLALIDAVRLTLWNLLGLMGISAPDRM